MLLVTHDWKKNHFGGRQQYSKCLIQALRQINEENFNIFKINPYKKQSFFGKLFSLNIDNITNKDIKKIQEIIIKKKIKIVFVDCSSFGFLTSKIKRLKKNIKIVIIHHHIEHLFFFQYLIKTKNLKYLFISLKMYINEILSTINSDAKIFFTTKDKKYAKFLFRTKKEYIFPVAQPIIQKSPISKNRFKTKTPYMLFVGGANLIFNVKGIEWFVKNVLPALSLNLVIVGEGFENIYNNKKNIQCLGRVEDLNNIYQNSEFIIAPIFGGSGMKTKVAEAAGYGKFVFGSNEALIGYEKYIGEICALCKNKEEFIKKINNYKNILKTKKEIIKIFNDNYSIKAMSINYSKVLLELQ